MARQWLESVLESNIIPRLSELKDTPDGHAEAERINNELRQLCENRNLKTTIQLQGPMDQVRRAIKDELGKDHFSLNFIGLTREEHTQINNRKQGVIAERNEQTQFLDQPDAIVGKAVRLLKSPEWADIAAGLAVLTGRRCAEILKTATFTPASKWSVTFTGALKRRGEPVELSFEIPTLTTAHKVCDALDRLRQQLDIQTPNPREINQLYEAPVARACDRHFMDLVPVRAGRDKLYTHLFRAVYATIATFWYCPTSVDETEFKAAIQGHFAALNEHDSTLRRSLNASRHYSDYAIADAVIAAVGGKRKGIKLGHGGVVPIAMFAHAVDAQPSNQRNPSTIVRLWKADYPTLQEVFILLGVEDGDYNQPQKMHRLLTWAQEQLTSPALDTTPGADADSLPAAAPPQPQEPAHLPPAPVAAPPAPSGLESKMESLIETMQQFIALQMTPARQAVPTPAPSLAPAPAPTPVQPSHPAATSNENPSTAELPKRHYQRKGATAELANRLIAAIKAHNDTPGMPHFEKWAISINALKVLGVSQRQAVKALEEHAEDIRQHHEKHQIEGEKHNLRHRRKRSINEVIKL